jgi:hypothetical protein
MQFHYERKGYLNVYDLKSMIIGTLAHALSAVARDKAGSRSLRLLTRAHALARHTVQICFRALSAARLVSTAFSRASR